MSNILKKQLAVVSLDFAKAFDRVDWDFIFSVVHKFGYGNKFIHMIQVAYNNTQSKIKINYLLSDPFTPMRRVHRGFHSQCCYILLRLRYLQFSLMSIQGLKEY